MRPRCSSMISKSWASTIAAMSVGVMPSAICGLFSCAVCRVQPSATRSCSTGRPIITALKFSIRSRCQPGFSCSLNSGGVGRLPRSPMADGVRWNTYTCFADSPSGGTAWMPLAPTPTTATTLSASLVRCGSSGAPPV